MSNTYKKTHMSFLLVEQFSAMCLMSAIEALRAVNHVLKKEVYSWDIISHDGNPVIASNGIEMSVKHSLSDDLDSDYLFVVASIVHNPSYKSKLHSRLQHFDRQKIKLGAISIGAFILARAGLLKDTKCTLHWEYIPAFQEEFPDIDVVNEIYMIDKNRFTCSGGISAMELMLDLIEAEYGHETSVKVANNFHLDRIRNATSLQRSGAISRLATMPQIIKASVKLMLTNTDEPLSNAEIADQINTSTRNLERLFKRHLDTSPAKYYLSLRLEKARELLMHTNLSTLDVALQSGFASSSYFARCFQKEFDKKPSDIRREN